MFTTAEIRKRRELSQSALAELLNVEQATVSAWECGISSPPANKLVKIAEVLNCSIEDLFEEEGNDSNVNRGSCKRSGPSGTQHRTDGADPQSRAAKA